MTGSVEVHGAKNAVLPLLASSILTERPVTVCDVPDISDVNSMISLLKALGLCASREGRCVTVSGVPNIVSIPETLSRMMRSSMFMLGALLTAAGEVVLPVPGGCRIGARPLDIHLDGLKRMGAEAVEGENYIHCYADKLKGADIIMRFPSVGATENLLMSATLAKGRTMLIGCAREPEIVSLAKGLRAMGARIEGEGTPVITVYGTDALDGCRVIPVSDRIEAGTYAAAVAACGGKIEIKNADIRTMRTVADAICDKHTSVTGDGASVFVESDGRAQAKRLVTGAYPLFPTDMQAQLAARLCTAEGVSEVRETVFENRFAYVDELKKMGADIDVSGNRARIRGVKRLTGARLYSSDLRGGAALVIAALSAQGESEVGNIGYIDRGYENFEGALSSLGAKIARRSASDAE